MIVSTHRSERYHRARSTKQEVRLMDQEHAEDAQELQDFFDYEDGGSIDLHWSSPLDELDLREDWPEDSHEFDYLIEL